MTTFTNDFSKEIWNITYKHHSDNTVDDTFKRNAKYLASAEHNNDDKIYWEEQFYDLLNDFKITLGGRIYANAGTEYDGTTLINCFVSPRKGNKYPHDSLEGILEDVKNQSLTLKSEGGWGQNFSFIRPRGSLIRGIGVQSPGAVKYMEIYDKSSDIITSGSGLENSDKKSKKKIRKGAMMGILDIWHPDIEEFITAKQESNKLVKFNLSVNLTNDFMTAVLNNTTWDLIFPDTSFKNYDSEWDGNINKWKEKNYPIIIYKTIYASDLFDKIVKSTYTRNEPGILFLDRANEKNPGYYHENIIATNPCGEQTLPESGVCNLGSLNIVKCLTDDNKNIDYLKVAKYAKTLVRMLDNVNTLSNSPLSEYKEYMENSRKIGCGVIGFASALYLMGIRYGSKKSILLIDKLMKFYAQELYKASIDLAEKKGMYHNCNPDMHINGKFIKQLELPQEYIDKLSIYGIRNSRLLSIQPTGNTSIFANIVSGGLEPIFLPEYIRTYTLHEIPDNIKDKIPKYWEGSFVETNYFKFITEGDEKLLKANIDGTIYKIDKNRGLTKEVLCEDYAVKILKADKLNWKNPKIHVTTENLSVEDHLNVLNSFSKWLDGACSKTINVPNDYPFEKFKNVYLEAYHSNNIVGVTTYRDGTMMTVLSSSEKKDDPIVISDNNKIKELENQIEVLNNRLSKFETPIKFNRPNKLRGETVRQRTGCGNSWITLTYSEDGNVREAFFQFGKAGGCATSMLEGLGRLTSLALKSGATKDDIIDQLSGISCPNPVLGGAKSCSDGLALAMKEIDVTKERLISDAISTIFNGENNSTESLKQLSNTKISKNISGMCPDCGSPLHYQEGCSVCFKCDYSKCS